MAGHAIAPAEAEVGRRIFEARTAAGVPRKALAAVLGISQAQLRKIEIGLNRVGAGRLQAIADHLCLPVTDLLGPAPAAPAAAWCPQPAQCAAFNAAHPVGSGILIWTGTVREGRPVAAIVAAPAVSVPGRAEPMVRVLGHGRIALTHVFDPCAGAARSELFLNGERIELESVPLRVDPAEAATLHAAARARGMTATDLALAVLRAVAADDLFDAVLEDGAQTRARRRYAEAA